MPSHRSFSRPRWRGMAAAVVAGTVHAGGVQGVDGGEMSIARLAGIVLGLREQGDLVDVPAHGMAHFLLHATEQPEVKATLGRLPAGVRNASQILDPLREEATQPNPAGWGAQGPCWSRAGRLWSSGLPDGAVGPAVEATMQAMRAAGRCGTSGCARGCHRRDGRCRIAGGGCPRAMGVCIGRPHLALPSARTCGACGSGSPDGNCPSSGCPREGRGLRPGLDRAAACTAGGVSPPACSPLKGATRRWRARPVRSARRARRGRSRR